MLSNEELFLSGDIDTLYLINKRLMYHIANKFSNLRFEYDDFIGCGDLAFAKALKNFNPNKRKWATYFSRIMVNEILIMNRKRNKEVSLILLDTVIYEDKDFNALTILDVVQSKEDVAEKVVNIVTLEEILKSLRDKKSLKLEIFKLYLQGVKQREIAKKLNISQSYVSRVIKIMNINFKSAYEIGAS